MTSEDIFKNKINVNSNKKIFKQIEKYRYQLKCLPIYIRMDRQDIKIKIFWSAGIISVNDYLKGCLSHLKKKPELIIKKPTTEKIFKGIILTWANKYQFRKDGSFDDKYLKINSKTKKDCLWVVITDQEEFHEQTNIVLVNLEIYKNLNLSNLFSQLFKVFIENNFSFQKFLHFAPYNSLFAKNLNMEITKILTENKISKILLPYESQPFQQHIIKNAKEFDSKILVEGYLHSILPSFPTEYIFRRYSPDRLLIHGSGQKEILNKFFFWPNKKLKLIKSRRYKKFPKEKKNFIYLPYNINNPKDLLKNFENFLSNQKDYSFKKTFIKPHPLKEKNIK